MPDTAQKKYFSLSNNYTVIPRFIGDTTVDVDVADHAQARTLYMHAQMRITRTRVLGCYDHRGLEFRKRHGGCEIEEGIHDATSKSKGQDILSVLPAAMHPVHTAR